VVHGRHPAVLGILMQHRVHCGSCAPAVTGPGPRTSPSVNPDFWNIRPFLKSFRSEPTDRIPLKRYVTLDIFTSSLLHFFLLSFFASFAFWGGSPSNDRWVEAFQTTMSLRCFGRGPKPEASGIKRRSMKPCGQCFGQLTGLVLPVIMIYLVNDLPRCSRPDLAEACREGVDGDQGRTPEPG